MSKNYSFYMLGTFLGLGSIIGLVFPFMLRFLVEVPEEDFLFLQLLALGSGWLLGAANYAVHYAFNRYVIRRFREVLKRVRSEDYSARVNFTSKDMLGLMADDVNATLSHLEEKNNEVQHDDLTGLPNRQFLKQHYSENVSRMAHPKTAFLFFDLDKFKEINDQFGHQVGDKVLIGISRRIQNALDHDEVLVRLSGDEFLLLAPAPDKTQAEETAKRLASHFAEPLSIGDLSIPVAPSIGISLSSEHGNALPELIQKADFAMYQAKNDPERIYCMYEEENGLTKVTT